MIGRLLQTAANTLGGPHDSATKNGALQKSAAKQLESNIEEAHTRDLLYPDIEALRTSQHSALPSLNGRLPATPAEANSFDDRGGLDVSFPHDVRVIIAQDANARQQAQILYDSNSRRAGTLQQEQGPAASQRLHTRGKSFTVPTPQPNRTGNRPQSSFLASADGNNPSSPLSPGRNRPFVPGFSGYDIGNNDTEGSHVRAARETKEETDSLLSCIFGAPGHRIEPGTKLHVLPTHMPEPERPRTRLGSSGLAGKRTELARSNTGFDQPRERGQSAPPPSSSGRTSIMVTRLFNVQLPEATVTGEDGERPDTSDDLETVLVAGPESSPHKPQPRTQRVKQKKTPAYAIAVIIHLPNDSFTRTRSHTSHGVISLPSSYQSSAPTSPRSTQPFQPASWMDSRDSGVLTANSVLSSQTSYILGNWSLLSRNIRLLEITARLRLEQLLEKIIPLTPLPMPSQGKAGNLKLRHPKPPSQQAVSVNADCLQNDVQVGSQAKDCLQRIANGLRTRRVTPGQSRWGAWREEARSINRWAGSKDQNFFFFVFMTAFLGQHTSWLEMLAPKWYRHRAARQKQSGDGDLEALPHRTVLVCKNKMDARKLIFLAASFLPTNFKNSFPALAPALFDCGDSPPTVVTPRESYTKTGLRNSFSNRRGEPGPSGHGRSVSFSIAQKISDEPSDEERNTFGEELGRRASEAGSVRSTFAPLNAPRGSRKTSTSTLLADGQLSARPVAHFSNLSIDLSQEPQTTERPGSSASMASVALNQALRRSESASTASVGNRLGSMVHGLWSSSTTNDSESGGSETAVTSPESTPHNRRLYLNRGQSTSGVKPSLRSPNPLDRMVQEAGRINRDSAGDMGASMLAPFGKSPVESRRPLDLESCLKKTPTGTSADDKPSLRKIPNRAESERMPLQLSMNETDGFVDVSMPPGQSLTTSLASSFASLRMSSAGYPSAYSSVTGLWMGPGAGALAAGQPHETEHFSPYGSPTFVGSPTLRPEKTPEVAGWLQSFHSDFLLQAVHPYDKLHDDVRAALQAEARLSQSINDDTQVEEAEEWRDVASILVADTSAFTVERVTLQRRKRRTEAPATVNPKLVPRLGTGLTKDTTVEATASPFFGSPATSTSSLTSTFTEEQIITEPLMDVDPVLIDAFERVLAQTTNADLHAHVQQHSKMPSRVVSRAHSPTRSRPVSVRSSNPGQHPQSTSAIKQKHTREQSQTQRFSAGKSNPDSGKFIVHQESGPQVEKKKEIPFAECRRIILGALEEITRTVIEDRDLREQTGGASQDSKKPGAGAVLSGHCVDGALREGVSRWLAKVEAGPRQW